MTLEEAIASVNIYDELVERATKFIPVGMYVEQISIYRDDRCGAVVNIYSAGDGTYIMQVTFEQLMAVIL